MKNLACYGKTAKRALVSSLLMTVLAPANATQLSPANVPLILIPSVAPNLILSLDDSGSMRWAYTPDNIDYLSATRRVKSSAFNPMYYNPAATYKLPTKVATNGTAEAVPYSTSFTNAYNNGFLTGNGSYNLSSSYRATWAYDPTGNMPDNSPYGDQSTSNSFAENPTDDFAFSTTHTATLTNGQNTSATFNNITFQINRISNPSCTASITSTPSNGQTLSCSRSGTNYTLTSTSDRRQNGVPAYYYIFDTSLPDCTAITANRATDDNCYKLVNVASTSGVVRADDATAGTDERANFARWYSFYRNRALTTLSGANLAFDSLDPNIRITWQNLNRCFVTDAGAGGCNNYLRKFTGRHRGNFFAWLTSRQFSGGTPLRLAQQRAGEFVKGATPWAENPNPINNSTGATGTTVTGSQFACRANYHVLMTDGVWNGGNGTPSTTLIHDGANATLLGAINYSQQHPFFDSTANTLADLAFHYWATDARDLANTVRAYIPVTNTDATAQFWNPKNDPATWQHLTTFTIGLGLSSSLQNAGLVWTGDTTGGAGYDNLVAGTAWPAAGSNSVNNVYDLWHAAINSRGKFFSADNPQSIVSAFSEILARISGDVNSAGAPGVTASIVGVELTRDIYETRLESDDWSGDLLKYHINGSGVRSKEWSVIERIAAQNASSRNIKMYDANASSKLKDFSWANLNPTQKTLLQINADTSAIEISDANGQLRLNFIRGDQSNEGLGSTQFRERSTVLGDIINSAPVIVTTPKYVSNLADRIEGLTSTDASSYTLFKAAKLTRTPMVYVGANDGMLHGFNVNSGDELFAYVPSAVLKNLYRLPAQNYNAAGHRFFVDGSPVVNDVYFGGAWHTVLVGSLRAGGRSLFALDITDPTDIKLLWERSFNDTTPAADLANLGYTFSQPNIARLHTGQWAVVTGNGYGNQSSSTPDKASLMIFNIETGALMKELVVTGDTTIANGLSGVKLADNNSDGIADYAYAGDLQGNMWRFDLVTTSSTPASPDPFLKSAIGNIDASTFKVSYDGRPLYSAFDGRSIGPAKQAISAPPSLVRHPSGLGYLVIFGTGKYFETGDGTADTSRALTLYGIWDKETKGKTTSTPSPILTRANLQAQTIDLEPANTFAANAAVDGIRILSQNTVDWTTKRGWLLDFKVTGASNAGEMLINPMSARGQTLLLSTITPNADPCSDGVGSWQYAIDPYTGGRTKFNVFDLDNSKEISSDDSYKQTGQTDKVISGYKKDGSGGFTTNNQEIFTSPDGTGMKYSPGPTSKGRQSWRAIETP
jgi:type IV pilus assembly protein PilY1